jgi:hypothetical protein
MRARAEEGGFILRYECISRVIKFDSKQTKTVDRAPEGSRNAESYIMTRERDRGKRYRYEM